MTMNVRQARRSLLLALIAVLPLSAAVTTNVHAYDEASVSDVNVDAAGVALGGHDPVAYFTAGTPTAGKAGYQATHGGATYRFASAASLAQFEADPERYVPQYGGFCAMGVALEKKLDGDPQAWRIVDGKLYLNLNKDVQKKWLEDVPGHLARANRTWPSIRSKAPRDL
jgi:YHS domain-containing protein